MNKLKQYLLCFSTKRVCSSKTGSSRARKNPNIEGSYEKKHLRYLETSSQPRAFSKRATIPLPSANAALRPL